MCLEKLPVWVVILSLAIRTQKGSIAPSLLKEQKTTINGKDYDYATYDYCIETAVYQKSAKGVYRKTRRCLKVCEIIILRKGGAQTHLVSSRTDLDPVLVPSTLFKQWTKEIIFRIPRRLMILIMSACIKWREPIHLQIIRIRNMVV